LTRKDIIAAFPRLKRLPFLITSAPTPNCNCIAWAADDNQRRWWPGNPFYFWPQGVPKADDLQSFVAAFGTIGYAPCDDGNLQHGLEKIAIYANALGHVKHAARQLENGLWTSKLGASDDISHTIYGLGGASYGDAVQYLARSRRAPSQVEARQKKAAKRKGNNKA
jgi:hypothetical protein